MHCKVINNSDFYRIMYSDEISVMTGLNIFFSLSNINIERYFQKVKCSILDSNNTTDLFFLDNSAAEIKELIPPPIII